MKYLGNAFSLGMLTDNSITLNVRNITLEQAFWWVDCNAWESCVGHADTASVLTNLLDVKVQFNRCSVKLKVGDEMLVAQYIGPRLTEGAIKLPEESAIKFFLVLVKGC